MTKEYKLDGKWEVWSEVDLQGKPLSYLTHFNGKFNSERVYSYDGESSLIYLRYTDVNGAVEERWYNPPWSDMSVLHDRVLRRYVDHTGKTHWFGHDGMHTTQEEWEKAFVELQENQNIGKYNE